ncbi:MAG: pentapeptide repeat-containing protein [Bacteroidota bacterium]
MEDTTRIGIKIKGKLSEFSLKLLQQFLRGIEGLLNIEDTEIRFVGAQKGSVILGLDLPTKQANYLNEVIELGRLEDLGILSATKLFRFRTLFEEEGPDPSAEYLPKKLQLFSSSTNLDLSYGKFAYLEAIQMDLSNSQLRYADLSRANLQNVNLENADLSYANLQDAQLLQIRLKGAKLEGMKANESQREALALAEADLSQVNFNSDSNSEPPLLQMPG